MGKLFKNSWALFLGYGIIILAHGLQGNLLGLRAVLENFNIVATGILMSGYFIGYFTAANIVPNLVLANPVISDNLDDLLGMLDEDQTILDIDGYLETDLTGDPNASTSTLTDGPGGSTVTTPTITGDQATTATDTDPVINDPNNIKTIDDYTPETNPYSCS